MFGGPLIFQQLLSTWDNDTVQFVRKFLDEEYKYYRRMIRDSKVYHLLPPSADPNNPVGWDAIQAVTEDKHWSIVLVFRTMYDVNTTCILPQGENILMNLSYSTRITAVLCI